jgi:hypothetical protein
MAQGAQPLQLQLQEPRQQAVRQLQQAHELQQRQGVPQQAVQRAAVLEGRQPQEAQPERALCHTSRNSNMQKQSNRA